jgi:hypothetical protein
VVVSREDGARGKQKEENTAREARPSFEKILMCGGLGEEGRGLYICLTKEERRLS